MPPQHSTNNDDKDGSSHVEEDGSHELSENDASLTNQGDVESDQERQTVPDASTEEEPLEDNNSSSTSSSSSNPPPPLSESSRLKGYIRLGFLSCLAFVSAYESDLEHCVQYSTTGLPSSLSDQIIQPAMITPTVGSETIILTCKQWNFGPRQELNPVPSTQSSRAYAMVVGGTSAVLNILIVSVHLLDGSVYVVKRAREMFRPGSSAECMILVFLGLCKYTYSSSHAIVSSTPPN